MDTQPTEAVANDANAPVEPTADYFTKLAEEEFGITDEPPEDDAPVEGEPTEGETDETDDDIAAEEEADDLPPIEPPVSWDAEAKEVFKSLPREAQEVVQKREAERERFVQQKSQEATQAKQTATQQAQAELAQLNAQYAEQLQAIASSIRAEQPDPMLQVTDPVAYAQQMRAYQQAEAQRSQAQQTAALHAQQAQALAQQAEQAFNAEQHRAIVEQFPEYIDPTTGPQIRAELSSVAKELGYSDELIGQARASDILAMRKAAEWKADSLKLKALNAKKMEKVRAAKGLPKVVTPGVAQGADAARARNAQSALQTVMTSRNRDVQGAAFYELAKANGWVS